MASSNRVQVCVICAILLAAFAATPGHGAQGPNSKWQIWTGSASLAASGNEPNASGTATLTVWTTDPNWFKRGDASFSCSGLTPGASYEAVTECYFSWGIAPVRVAGGTANAEGELTISGRVGEWWGWPVAIRVDRVAYGPVLWGPIVLQRLK
jgi:hypothetical protein